MTTNKNIKMSSFKSSENIQKKECGPDKVRSLFILRLHIIEKQSSPKNNNIYFYTPGMYVDGYYSFCLSVPPLVYSLFRTSFNQEEFTINFATKFLKWCISQQPCTYQKAFIFEL